MRQHVLLLIWCALFYGALARSKYNQDGEDNPYEFGFTIDGQQHRHEKKDANGIIQGEFGFITADGVYHVTVYATDEDGNFKILSMRNVKISGPLDQEGKLPDTSQFSKGNPAPQPNPLSVTTAAPPPVQVVTEKSTTKFAGFTTQPTIKPACAGCGYVTTQKSVNGNKLNFQTPSFQPGAPPEAPFVSKPISSPGTPFVPGNANQDLYSPNQPNARPPIAGGVQNEHSSPQTGGTQNDNVSPQTGSIPNDHFSPQTGNIPNYPPQVSPGVQNETPQNYPANPANNIPETPNHFESGPPVQNVPNDYEPSLGNPNPNPLAVFTDRPPSGIEVTKDFIMIPNNPPIPIQDKYPNMVEGPPPGMDKGDITDLLYKFNYTVGFHGHYEKGYKNGAKIGGYFVNDRDGVSRIVTYVADENGYRPKVRFIRLDLNSDLVPKEGTEKNFGLKNFEFVWYPLK